MSLENLPVLSGYLILSAHEGEKASIGGAVMEALPQILTTVVGFLLVYWVLKRFAFGPLLSVIDERRNKIEGDLQRAEDLRNQALAHQTALEERLRNFERESREKMVEVINEGKRVAASLQENARKEADEILQKAQKNIQYETERAREQLKAEIVNLTIHATERLIKERLDDQKHRELIGDFVSQLERS